MNLWLFIVLATAALSTLVSSAETEVEEIILAIYKHQNRMKEKYLRLEQEIIKNHRVNPCLNYKEQIPELKYNLLDIKSEVKYGDFNNNNGYYLIVNESTIEIPAIIKCISKYKNGEPFVLYGNEVVYYMIILLYGNEMYFRRAYPFEYINENKDKSTFIISQTRTVEYFMMTYINNGTTREHLIEWHNDNQLDIKKLCKDLAPTGEVSEGSVAKWKIINGEIKSGTYILHITHNITVEIPIIIQCRVKVHDPINKIRNPKTVKKYFAIAKINPGKDTFIYTYIRGPIIIDEIEHYALTADQLTKIRKN